MYKGVDVATRVYDVLEKQGGQLACNLARRTGLKYSTVYSFLRRQDGIGIERHPRNNLWFRRDQRQPPASDAAYVSKGGA